MNLWQVSLTELIVFPAALFVAAACDRLFMSKTTDPRIVADGLDVLEMISDRLVREID